MAIGYKKDNKYIEDFGDQRQILSRVRHVVVMVQGSYRREESDARITWQYQEESWILEGKLFIDNRTVTEYWEWKLSHMAHPRFAQAKTTVVLCGTTEMTVRKVDEMLSNMRLVEEMRVLATKNSNYGNW